MGFEWVLSLRPRLMICLIQQLTSKGRVVYLMVGLFRSIFGVRMQSLRRLRILPFKLRLKLRKQEEETASHPLFWRAGVAALLLHTTCLFRAFGGEELKLRELQKESILTAESQTDFQSFICPSLWGFALLEKEVINAIEFFRKTLNWGQPNKWSTLETSKWDQNDHWFWIA